MQLKITSRDGRAPLGWPIALLDLGDHNRVISFHKRTADAAKARLLLQEVAPFAAGFTAQQLNELARSICAGLYHREIHELKLGQFNGLLRAVKSELEYRKQLSSPEYWGQ